MRMDAYTSSADRFLCEYHEYFLRFLDFNFDADDHGWVIDKFAGNPRLAKIVVEDFLTDNDAKINLVSNEVSFGSKIFIILGKRGGGKTSLVYFLADLIRRMNKSRQIYAYGAFRCPDFIRKSFSFNDFEPNSVVIMDEASILLSARDSASGKNRTIIDMLPILRHKGLTVFFISQSSGLLDINIFRMADGIFFVPMSLLSTESSERKDFQVIDEITALMLPRASEIGVCLYRSADSFVKFRYNKPLFFTDELSKAYSRIDDEALALQFASALHDNDWELKDIKRVMALFHFDKPLSYWKETFDE